MTRIYSSPLHCTAFFYSVINLIIKGNRIKTEDNNIYELVEHT